MKLIILIPFLTTSFPTSRNFWCQLSKARQWYFGCNCPALLGTITLLGTLLWFQSLPCLGQLPPKILVSWKRSGQKWYQNFWFCTSNGLEWILRIQICQIHWIKVQKVAQKKIYSTLKAFSLCWDIRTCISHFILWKTQCAM